MYGQETHEVATLMGCTDTYPDKPVQKRDAHMRVSDA